MLYWLVIGIMRILMLFRRIELTVYGSECIPKSGPVVLVPRHSHWQDIPAVALLTAIYTKRHVTFMAKDDYYKNKIFARLFDRWGAIKVNRGKADRTALETAKTKLQNGQLVCVFPEGKRNDKLGKLHAGWAMIARRSEMNPTVVAVNIYWTSHNPMRANIHCVPLELIPGEDDEAATERLRRVLDGFEPLRERWDGIVRQPGDCV